MTIETNPKFWDCECRTDFIHPKPQGDCKKCGAREGSQPDSHAGEVAALGLEKKSNEK